MQMWAGIDHVQLMSKNHATPAPAHRSVLVPMEIVLACEKGTLPLYQQYQERILGQYSKILLEGDRGTGEPHVHLSLLYQRPTRAR
jgi:hypothetical protein